MGWIFDDYEAKTKEDYIALLNEINAYRELDGEDFDFGDGLIKNEMSYGSEDAYYEMDIDVLEFIINNWEEKHEGREGHNRSNREHKYARNRKHRKKMYRLANKRWTHVWMNNSDYPKRYYRGRRYAYLKKQSEKKIRKYKGGFQPKGSKFRRVYDLWWMYD